MVELADSRVDALDDRDPLDVTEGVVDVLKEKVALADVDEVTEAEAERLPRFDILPVPVPELLFDTVTEDDPVFVEIAEFDPTVLTVDDGDGFIVTERVLEGVCVLVPWDVPVILGDAEDERLAVDDGDGRGEAVSVLLMDAEDDAVRETYDVIDTAADRVGLDVADEERDGLPEGVFVVEEEGVLLILALPLAVLVVVVVLDELVEPDDVLLTVALVEERGLDVGVLELAAVCVLVLLAVVVALAAADGAEI